MVPTHITALGMPVPRIHAKPASSQTIAPKSGIRRGSCSLPPTDISLTYTACPSLTYAAGSSPSNQEIPTLGPVSTTFFFVLLPGNASRPRGAAPLASLRPLLQIRKTMSFAKTKSKAANEACQRPALLSGIKRMASCAGLGGGAYDGRPVQRFYTSSKQKTMTGSFPLGEKG